MTKSSPVFSHILHKVWWPEPDNTDSKEYFKFPKIPRKQYLTEVSSSGSIDL